MPAKSQKDNQIVNSPAPQSALAPVPVNIGELRTHLESVLGARYKRVAALTFATASLERPITFAAITELVDNAPEVLRQLLAEDDQRPAVQAAFHGFWTELFRQCKTTIALHCRPLPLTERVAVLAALLDNFLEAPSPSETLDFCAVPAWHRALEKIARRAQTIAAQAEAILDLPGLLTGETAHSVDESADLHLESTFEGPARDNAFGLLLRQVRGELTQSAFAEIFRSFGLKQLAVSNWENGVYVPARRMAHIVKAISERFRSPQLYSEYVRARDRIDATNLFARRRDVNFHVYLRPHEAEFRDFLSYSSTRVGVPRAGKRYSRGKYAANTLKSYSREVAHALAAVRLPADSPNPRTRGLGWENNIGLVSLILPEALEANVTLRMNRRGSQQGKIANADKVGLALLASWTSQPDGWLWRRADRVAALNPGAVERMPTHWPETSLINPGKPCESAADRIRAQCLISAPYLSKLVRSATTAPCRTQHHAALGPVVAKFSLPVAGVFAVLDRLKLEGEIKSEQKWYEAVVASYLARCAYRPPRISDGLSLELHQLNERNGEFLLYVQRPEKNPDSANACTDYLGIVPRELNVYLRPYHRARLARGGKGDAPYFTTYDGKVMTQAKLRYLLEKILRCYGGDIFPQGMGSHDMRYVVATSLGVFAGKEIGLPEGAKALRDSSMTVTEKYILVRLEEDYHPPFPVRHLTHREMLRLARQQARDFAQKSKYVPVVPKAQRRSPYEIAQAKLRFQRTSGQTQKEAT